MNKIILMGRITRDPEVRYTQGEKPTAITRYSIAVDKKFKHENGNKTDFFNVVVFGYQADFAAKYFRQGTKVLLSGRVQTGSYDNRDGVKVPFFEVVAEEQEFAESKNGKESNIPEKATNQETVFEDGNGFMQIPDNVDELPFN